jgi:cytochrome c
MNGPLIAASATMVTAWEFPKTPLADAAALGPLPLSDEIKRGFRIFTDTPREVPQLAPGGMSCSNCHMNGGQREKSLPLVGVAGLFPVRRQARRPPVQPRRSDRRMLLRSENTTGDVEF